jgi:hypothetical protein
VENRFLAPQRARTGQPGDRGGSRNIMTGYANIFRGPAPRPLARKRLSSTWRFFSCPNWTLQRCVAVHWFDTMGEFQPKKPLTCGLASSGSWSRKASSLKPFSERQGLSTSSFLPVQSQSTSLSGSAPTGERVGTSETSFR